MRIKVQYNTIQEREELVEQHKDLLIVEEINIREGNFIVFTDEQLQDVFINELQQKVKTTELKINALDSKTELIEGALVELTSLVLE